MSGLCGHSDLEKIKPSNCRLTVNPSPLSDWALLESPIQLAEKKPKLLFLTSKR